MKIKNGFSYEKNGWKYISINGNARERGYAYGYLCASDFIKIQKMFNTKTVLPVRGLSYKVNSENHNYFTFRCFVF